MSHSVKHGRLPVVILLTIGVLFLLVPLLRPAGAQEKDLRASKDTFVQVHGPDENYDRQGLILSRASFPEERAASAAYVQFNLAPVTAVGNGSVVNFSILNNLSGADGITITLHAVDDDSWDSSTMMAGDAPALGKVLQTISLPGDYSGPISFGHASDPHPVGDFVSQEFKGDGLVSFGITIEGDPAADLFGTVSVEDAEGSLDGLDGDEPGLTVRFTSYMVYLPTIIRPAILDLVGDQPTGAVADGEARDIATSPVTEESTAAGIEVVDDIAADGYCSPPAAPNVSIGQDSQDIVLSWAHHPANSDAYNIWRSTEDPFFPPAGDPYRQIATGSNSFRDKGALAPGNEGNSYYYIVEAVSLCHGTPARSATVGATFFALDGNGFSLIAQPYHNSPTQTAADVAAQVPRASLLLKWNPDRQGLFFYMPDGQGSDFPIGTGDTVYIHYLGSATGVVMLGEVVRTESSLAPGGYAFTALPSQLGDISNASEVAAEIGNVASVMKWDSRLQGFLYYEPPRDPLADGGAAVSSALADFSIRRGDPFGVRLLPGGPTRWPADQGMMTWSQRINGESREVLFQWYPGQLDNWPKHEFEAWREVQGSGAWERIGVTAFAESVEAMVAVLGKDMTAILSYDLRQPGETKPLNEEEIYRALASQPDKALSFANQHYEVALAVGLAFLDATAKQGVDYAYYAAPPKSLEPPYQPVCVPGKAAEPFSEFRLREAMVANVPAGLGERPSSRPYDAIERYQWDTYQDVRRMDGQAFLIWNTPPDAKPPASPTACSAAPQLEIAGYHVYRYGRSLADWTLVNAQSEGAQQTKSGIHMLIDASAEPGANNPDNEPFYVQDDIATLYAHLGARGVYDTWAYQVCAVDRLRQEMGCSLQERPLEVRIRELDSPAGILNASVQIQPSHEYLTLTWTYNDPGEESPPLRFFITRSPTMTLPAEEWTELTPAGIHAPAASPTFTINFTDTPPLGQTFWYRIKARDHAGNWSPPSAPAAGGLFDRQAPKPPAIEGDISCNNEIPVTVQGLGKDVRQLAVYRAFEKNGPYRLIKRLQVSGSTLEFDDLYVPPNRITAYYKFEAIDGHGNVSDAFYYCAQLGDPVAPGPIDLHAVQEGSGVVIIYNAPKGSEMVTVTVELAQGTLVFTSTTSSGNIYVPDAANQAVLITGLAGNYSGQSVEKTLWWMENNDFMNTGRPMTYLGALDSAEWTTINGKPAVLVSIGSDYDPPWVSLYRRVPGGHWLQVSPIQEAGLDSTMIISDTADLDPAQVYSYTVLAFSPTSHEVIGFWDPIELPADTGSNEYASLTEPINHVQEPPSSCEAKKGTPPAEFPTKLALPNGWQLQLDEVLVSNSGDPACPPSSPDLNNLYGRGTLDNGDQTWTQVGIFGVGFRPTDPGHAEMVTGQISHNNLSYHQSDISGWFEYVIWGVLFDGDAQEVHAEVMINLPDGVKFYDYDRRQWNPRLFGVYPGLQTNMRYGQLNYGDPQGRPVLFMDESLPWQMSMKGFGIDPKGIYPAGQTETIDRLRYPLRQDGFLPDNNLGFMRRPFTSENAQIKDSGVQGTFLAKDPILYQTGLPAGIVIEAGETTVQVQSSRIAGGSMDGRSAQLYYDDLGSSKDAFVPASNQPTVKELAPCYRRLAFPAVNSCLETRGNASWAKITLAPAGGRPLEIGSDGMVTGAMVDVGARIVRWPQFFLETGDIAEGHVNLYLAKATFPEENPAGRQEPDAPIMAEVAWRQLPDPTGSFGDLDPGINFNSLEATFGYEYFDPPEFNITVDAYLRRGGISEQFKAGDPGDTLRQNNYGYQETVQKLEALFIDNMFGEDGLVLQSDLYLPYPSDVTIPLSVTDSLNSLPIGGVAREQVALHHKYWDLRQTIADGASWSLVALTRTVYINQALLNGLDLAILPDRVFHLEEGLARINGLKVSGTQDDAQVPIKSQWFPDGDYGQVVAKQLTTNTDENYDFYQVGGVPFAFTGAKLSHYYSRFMDPTSLPDTMGVKIEGTGIEMPAELTDASGNLTPQSLKDCSAGDTVGCGFVLLDGNGTSDFFGEVELVEEMRPAPALVAADGFQGDEPEGQWPVANNNRTNQTTQANTKKVALRWAWAVVDDYIDELCPFVYLPNQNGGVFACVKEGLEIVSAPADVFKGDLSLVADFNNNGTADVGIFVGYSASQGALRALAMNRPREDGLPGFITYTNWISIEQEIITWTHKFYPDVTIDEDRTNRNDPVDLAAETWEAWGTREFGDAFLVLSGTLRSLTKDQAAAGAYGVTGLMAGSVLQDYGDTTLQRGMGQAEFFANGLDLTLERLYFGSEIDIGADDDQLLHADWLSLQYTRDGLYMIRGERVTSSVTGDYDITADFDLHIFTADQNERVEGGILIDKITLSDLEFQDLGLAFGAGRYDGKGLYYFGAKGEAVWDGYTLGGAILAGTVYPSSEVLRFAGFGHVLDKLQAESPGTDTDTLFVGLYLAVDGDFPIYNEGCLLDVTAGGEIRFWYFKPDGGGNATYGGQLQGSVYGEFACILSARGDLSLTLEQVNADNHSSPPPGWASMTRQCPAGGDDCSSFAGIFWVAVGVGFDCDPGTWDSWDTRWWGDSWCYTVGAAFGLTYINPTIDSSKWDYDYDIDWE